MELTIGLILIILVGFLIVHEHYKTKRKPDLFTNEEDLIVRNEDLKKEILSNIEKIILKHAKTLAVKQKQTVYKDDYGNYVLDPWMKEIDYFFEKVLLKDDVAYDFLKAGDIYEQADNRSIVSNMIIEIVAETRLKMIDDAYLDIDGMDGDQFERYCSLTLNKYGWNAKVTKASGDQGIDVIAEMNGMTVVFQCKRYSQPVGNSAVQEAIAGKQFAQAEIAAVITNSTYTKSAKQLASAANVYLLHHTDLESFKEIIFGE